MKKLLGILLPLIVAAACFACSAPVPGTTTPTQAQVAAPTPKPTPSPTPEPTPDPKTLPEYHSLEAIQERGVLTVSVGTYDSWANYHVPDDPEKYGEYAGTRAGLVPFLCEQLAGDMGVELRYIEYSSLEDEIAAAQDGDVDISASNWSITPERLERYSVTHNFSIWDSVGTAIYLRANPENPAEPVIENEEQLKTAKIAAVAGSQQAENAILQYPEAQIVPLPDNTAVLDALINGKTDAAAFTPYDKTFHDSITTAWEERKIHTSNFTIQEEEELGMGLILMKGNDALTDYVNARLAEYIENGQIEEWYEMGGAGAKQIGIA